jgi:hypothetical protein
MSEHEPNDAIAVLLAVEWRGRRTAIAGASEVVAWCCPRCESMPSRNELHATDCELDRALADAGFPAETREAARESLVASGRLLPYYG